MTGLIQTALTLAAGGLILTLIELLLPRSAIRGAAKTAIGLVFLEMLATQIADIFL
jgi:hypothetical protein